jgi:hypothetical protein
MRKKTRNSSERKERDEMEERERTFLPSFHEIMMSPPSFLHFGFGQTLGQMGGLASFE